MEKNTVNRERRCGLQTRLPQNMLGWIKTRSKQNERSMNAEIVSILKEKWQAENMPNTG